MGRPCLGLCVRRRSGCRHSSVQNVVFQAPSEASGVDSVRETPGLLPPRPPEDFELFQHPISSLAFQTHARVIWCRGFRPAVASVFSFVSVGSGVSAPFSRSSAASLGLSLSLRDTGFPLLRVLCGMSDGIVPSAGLLDAWLL